MWSIPALLVASFVKAPGVTLGQSLPTIAPANVFGPVSYVVHDSTASIYYRGDGFQVILREGVTRDQLDSLQAHYDFEVEWGSTGRYYVRLRDPVETLEQLFAVRNSLRASSAVRRVILQRAARPRTRDEGPPAPWRHYREIRPEPSEQGCFAVRSRDDTPVPRALTPLSLLGAGEIAGSALSPWPALPNFGLVSERNGEFVVVWASGDGLTGELKLYEIDGRIEGSVSLTGRRVGQIDIILDPVECSTVRDK